MKRTKSFQKKTSNLYLVATPIGNLNEISSRALDILKSVDVIACEDTRTSSVLLKHYGIDTKTIAYHNFNEEESTKGIIGLLLNEKNVALISDAGYPLLSDPGFELVKKCRDEGIAVSTISGPNACLNALVASGLDTRHFMFYGFLNSKENQAKKELEDLLRFPYTIVFYEAPHRIQKTLENIYEIFGDRKAVIGRELTKLHEEYIEGNLSELKELDDLKGEIVLCVEGYKEEIKEISYEEAFKLVDEQIHKGLKMKDAIKIIAGRYNLSRNDLYDSYIKR